MDAVTNVVQNNETYVEISWVQYMIAWCRMRLGRWAILLMLNMCVFPCSLQQQHCQCHKSDWIPAGRFCYKFHAVFHYWDAAKTQCQKQHSATLPILKTQQDNADFGRLAQGKGPMAIGLQFDEANHDKNNEDHKKQKAWIWIDDSSDLQSSPYTNWHPNAPDRITAAANNVNVYFSNGKWRNDDPSTLNIAHYACQLPCITTDVSHTKAAGTTAGAGPSVGDILLYTVLVVGILIGIGIGIYLAVLHDTSILTSKCSEAKERGVGASPKMTVYGKDNATTLGSTVNSSDSGKMSQFGQGKYSNRTNDSDLVRHGLTEHTVPLKQ